ncbi:MAG: CoA-binding protein [Candidatus Micrarchaeia archaeon]
MKKLLEPSSVAVIGASRDPGSVGYGVLKSLVTGCVLKSPYCSGFPGKIYAVNPNAARVLGIKCLRSVLDAPGKVDLAIVCVPAAIVPAVLRECGLKHVGAAVVVSAGFAEKGTPESRGRQEELACIARDAGMLLLGPNCLGVLRPSVGLNASFGASTPPAGGIAFITQSGALADSVIDWSLDEMHSFSAIVSLGNMAALGPEDFVDWFATDAKTKAIALYLEGFKDGRALMAAIRKAVAAGKPVFVLKGGRSEEGAKAVSSHTASMSGSYAVFKAAMRQSGAHVVDSLTELFEYSNAASTQPKAKGNGVAIITNGGGAGVLCADYCEKYGVKLSKLSERALRRLDKHMSPAYSRSNPLDIIGDARPERYEKALEIVAAEKNVRGIIVIQTLQTMTDAVRDAQAVIKAKKKHPDKPFVTVFMGGKYSRPGKVLLRKAGIPDYNDPKPAAKAMGVLVSPE